MSTEVGSGSDDVSSRSSAGGEDQSNSEGKKKKRKRKREKEKHMTRQDKKKEVGILAMIGMRRDPTSNI